MATFSMSTTATNTIYSQETKLPFCGVQKAYNYGEYAQTDKQTIIATRTHT